MKHLILILGVLCGLAMSAYFTTTQQPACQCGIGQMNWLEEQTLTKLSRNLRTKSHLTVRRNLVRDPSYCCKRSCSIISDDITVVISNLWCLDKHWTSVPQSCSVLENVLEWMCSLKYVVFARVNFAEWLLGIILERKQPSMIGPSVDLNWLFLKFKYLNKAAFFTTVGKLIFFLALPFIGGCFFCF